MAYEAILIMKMPSKYKSISFNKSYPNSLSREYVGTQNCCHTVLLYYEKKKLDSFYADYVKKNLEAYQSKY